MSKRTYDFNDARSILHVLERNTSRVQRLHDRTGISPIPSAARARVMGLGAAPQRRVDSTEGACGTLRQARAWSLQAHRLPSARFIPRARWAHRRVPRASFTAAPIQPVVLRKGKIPHSFLAAALQGRAISRAEIATSG